MADLTVKEKILCAAVKYKKGIHDIIVTGHRHGDCLSVIQALVPNVKWDDLPGREAQGFLTSHNRYVDRAEAFKIAKENKQFIHNMFDNDSEGILTSEDLY